MSSSGTSSASAQISPVRLPFDEVRATALGQAENLLYEWFPAGKIRGHEFCIGNLAGDPGDSLRINLKTGKWSDFAEKSLDGFDLSRFDSVHEYTDAHDRISHYVGRTEPKNGNRKYFTPVTWGILDGKSGWHMKHPADPRPLYGLNRLSAMPEATVIICEGEKSADVAQIILPDYACISFGCTSQAGKVDIAPLTERDCIIWPDADISGVGLAAARILQERLPGSRVIDITGLAEIKDGFDADDLMTDDPKTWLQDRLKSNEPLMSNHTSTSGTVLSINGFRKTEDQYNGTAVSLTPLVIIKPTQWEGVPVRPREWIVPDWLPVGHTTLCYGDGGTGKGLLVQELLTSCVTIRPWCGLAVTQCRGLGVFCEDTNHELHRRQTDINDHLGVTFSDLADLQLISRTGLDNVMVNFINGHMQATKLFHQIEAAVMDFGAKLLVLDTAADIFGGNEIVRREVRAFIGLLTGLAMRMNGAVLLNAHPSRAGMASGSGDGGSTAWNNSCRSRWTLARPNSDAEDDPDRDLRILTRVKANYASIGDSIELRWQNGVLVPTRQPTGIIGSITRQNADQVFLDLLDRTRATNQWTSHNPRAGNYAPKIFSKRPDRQGFTKSDFEKAMHRLLAARSIEVEEYRSTQRKICERLARSGAEASRVEQPKG
jgi:RecA-family ATPase